MDLKIHTLAGVDIGTNAMRLLIMNVIDDEEKPVFMKSSLVRVPIRLGMDVFQHGKISEKKKEQLLNSMQAFRYLMLANEVSHFRVCATSAMREASNSREIIDLIKNKTDMEIEVISGKEEAEILYSSHFNSMLRDHRAYLFIDVGGGSTEITVFLNKKAVYSQSFNIGTIRIMKNQASSNELERMRLWLQNINGKYHSIQAVGTGGNINKIFKLADKKEGRPIKYEELKRIHRTIEAYSIEDRIKILNLNPDRADVISIAGMLYLNAMKWAGIKTMLVPQIGLSDGIVRRLYTKAMK